MSLRHRHRHIVHMAQAHGFAHVMRRHAAVFFPRGSTLIVSFDNMKSREMPAPALPWAYRAVAKAGHSHLAVMMSRRNDWFRHADVLDFFDDLQARQFFAGFDRVVFFGASMGGYGALAFSASCPGADCVVFAPQTSLDPAIVPFDTRYGAGFARGDWTAPRYLDGAQSALSARRVTVFADPYQRTDAAHVARLPQHNLNWMACPNFGHNPARVLKHADLLGQVTRAAWNGTLTSEAFALARRGSRFVGQGVTRGVLLRAIHRGHARMALRCLEALELSRPDWRFPRIRQLALHKLEQAQDLAA